jgi:hypothetical protein
MSTVLQADLDLSFVLDAGRLDRVAFNQYYLQLLFDGLAIVVGSPCEVIAPDQLASLFIPGTTFDMSMFLPLFGSAVRSYKIVPEEKLVITFENGFDLALIDDHKGHECFVLRTPDGGVLAV